VTNAVTGYIFTTVRGSFACMTRLARVVIPRLPHDVTQRRNRREAIFFKDGDQELLPAAGPALRSLCYCWCRSSHAFTPKSAFCEDTSAPNRMPTSSGPGGLIPGIY
jgi:hypothetical protein